MLDLKMMLMKIAERLGKWTTVSHMAPTNINSNLTTVAAETFLDKSGKTVTLGFRFTTNASINAETQLMTIPPGYRPVRMKRFFCPAWGTGTTAAYMFSVQSDGVFKTSSNLPAGIHFIYFITYTIP